MEADSDRADINVGAVSLSDRMPLRESLLIVLLSKLSHAVSDQGAGIRIDEGRRRGWRAVVRQNAVRILLQLGR